MWKRDWPANTTSPGLLVSFARLRRNRAIRRLAASCFRGTTLVGLGCRVDRRTIVMTNGGPASGQTFFGSPCSGKTLIDQQPPHRTRIASCESDYWRIEKSCQHLLLSGFARLVALSKLPACDLTDFVSLSLTSRSKTKTIVIACKLRGLLQGTRTRPSTRHHCLPWPIRRKHTCLNFRPSSRTESMPKVFPS